MKFLKLLTVVQLCTALLVPGLAAAQPYPTHSIRLIVPYAPGGQPDIIARIVSTSLSATLGQSFVVENLPGSSGISAIRTLTGTAPDGYTLIALDAGHWAINPAVRTKLPYDPVTSFTPIGMISTSSLFIAVHESVPANNIQELVALAKAKPGALSYGSSGVGSVHHITAEAFKQALGLDIVHIPYKGTGNSVPALVGAQVQMVVSALNSLAPYAKDGRIKILAANTSSRSALAPDIPAISELVPGFDFPGQLGLFGPAGMPPEVVARIGAALATALRSPDVLAAFKMNGVEPPSDSRSSALAKRISEDRDRYGVVIKAAALPID